MIASIFIMLVMAAALGLLVYYFPRLIRAIKPDADWWEVLLIGGFVIATLLFCMGNGSHTAEYMMQIDSLDNCYTPFGGKHVFSLYIYFALFISSAVGIWIKGRAMPPLMLTLALSCLFIGTILNVFILIQLMGHDIGHDTSSLEGNDCYSALMIWLPLFSFLFSVLLIIKIIKAERKAATSRYFKNSFLNTCNSFLRKSHRAEGFALLLIFPVFLLVTVILIVFGQDTDSLVKVFTDTTTWTFSQKSHPPILTHEGHYLCTVAAKGNPRIVKPIRLGSRHGQEIVVNRQLQIANAFEELISDKAPSLHRFIRRNYDKYGYNLSVKINTVQWSNLTYILMKPLEWLFLICVYLFCLDPEAKIKRQYRL